MKLKENLVKMFRRGEVGLIYDGKSLDLLRLICNSDNVLGNGKYYWGAGHNRSFAASLNYPMLQFDFLDISEFVIKENEPAEEWQPKNGELVSVSVDGENWAERTFIGVNMLSAHKYVACNEDGALTTWKHIRQIKTINRKEAEEKLGLKIID